MKPLYGRQEGAEIGYSPSKPGRPSHCYHTLCIARLRLVLGVVIHAGDETSGVHSCGMLDAFLKWLPGRARPGLVRGDVGFGNETVIACCESNGVPYLFKLKRTRLVKDMKRTAIAAGLSAFVANCWNIFCRLGGDGSHQEATTTRRRLQDCVARIARHGRRRTVTLFTAGKGVARRVFGEISVVLEKVSSASQLTPEMRWLPIIYYAFRKYRLVQRLYPPLMGDQITLPLS